MTLARYNQIVAAIAGTALIVGVVVLALFFVALGRSGTNPGVAVALPSTNKQEQHLVFCPPMTEPGAAYQYIPVAAVVARNAKNDPSISSDKMFSFSSRSFDGCSSYVYGEGGRTFNVVVRNLRTGAQRLLLDQIGQIKSIDLPSEKCAQGEGETPCGFILWGIRTADSNHDGTINSEDAVVAYASSLDASKLMRLTPDDATVLNRVWVPKAEKWQFQIRRDTNKDGRFSDEDGSELVETSSQTPALAAPFVEPQVLKRLDAVAR